MAELTERDRILLEKVSRGQRASTVIGIVLTLAGLGYVSWAVHLFDYRVDPRTQWSFDGPVADLAFLYDRYQRILDKVEPESDVEKLLLEGVRRGMYFSSGVMVLMLRIYIGTLVGLMGLVALTVVVERRRLLRMIEQLEP